jgi:hypothetical protein
MKITHHITFFYLEQRIPFINRIIEEANTYGHAVDIFIHTNKDILTDIFTKLTVGTLTSICHDLSGIHPYKLSWKCRDLLSKQKDDYDIFIYIEDDILIPSKALDYWIEYSPNVIQHGYTLGFLRVEQEEGKEFVVDVTSQLTDTLTIDQTTYVVNNRNPYCACWIYSKEEFNRFVSSEFYNLSKIPRSDDFPREISALGLNTAVGLGIPGWYKGTIIPIEKLDSCKVIHLDARYVKIKNGFSTIELSNIFRR